MIKSNVVIIDSGISIEKYSDVLGIGIEYLDDGFVASKQMNDAVGHGTIIYSIINKYVNDDQIFVIKLPDQPDQRNDACLVFALKYIKQNIDCKIINISLGIRSTEYIDELYSICKELSDMGRIIVSAFDNEGCYSYPASYDCIIGVDTPSGIKNINDFLFVESSPINILAKGSLQRITTCDGRKVIVSGTSIACANITSIIAGFITDEMDFQNVLSYLKSMSSGIYRCRSKVSLSKSEPFMIGAAAVFPFTKETHALVRFGDMLSFHINEFYDVRYSGKVGRQISAYFEDVKCDKIISNIDSLNVTNVDTIILGHLDEINSILGYDYREDIIKKAIKNGINIYSFDPLDQYINVLNSENIKYYFPNVTKDDVPQNTFGKLYKIDKPVLGIYGTSSKQGKFSLQLTIKHILESMGYNVGAVGTEPHSLLFGLDVVFPMGYNSTVRLSNNDIVLYLNNEINKLCRRGKEIILTASQAQTVPYYCNNILEFPNMQYHFALGTQPDAIVLCVNIFDELSYIRYSVYALVGLTRASVVAFVVFPLTFIGDWKEVFGSSKRKITDKEFGQFADTLKKEFNKPVFLLGEKQHMEDLCREIVNFF